jgi:hypothetical protein
MLCNVSLSSSRSAGFQPAWRPSQEGNYPRPLFGRLGQTLGPPDERGPDGYNLS